MKEEFTKAQRELKDRMRKEAEERQRVQEELKNEELLKKQETVEQKKKLRELQEEDKRQKEATRNREMAMYKSSDFQDENILSQVYEHKTNKAYEYQKKNDQLQRLISTKFPNRGDRNFVEELIEREEVTRKTREEEEIKRKQELKKKKELETKQFQDEQIA